MACGFFMPHLARAKSLIFCAITPFVHPDAAMRADLNMAAQILEERALKTRQFFNAIAEDWDEFEPRGSWQLICGRGRFAMPCLTDAAPL